MILPCRECKKGRLTLVCHPQENGTALYVVQCATCGARASQRDAADYYRERGVKGPNLFEEKL